MTYDEIISKVASESGLPIAFVNKVYKAYWRAIKEHISSIPLKKELTDEEFMRLQPNVNIPSIGKLHVTLDRYKKKRKEYKIKTKQYVTHTED